MKRYLVITNTTAKTNCNASKQQHLLLAEEKDNTPSNKNNEKRKLQQLSENNV